MEMLGHSFHLFLNEETETFSVVYRRENGDYGLLEPTNK
jgi:putative sigma-54 modulation protein